MLAEYLISEAISVTPMEMYQTVKDHPTIMHQICQASTPACRHRSRLKYPFAIHVPCSGHSLNLVDSCVTVTSFFLLLQELYNFFSSLYASLSSVLPELYPSSPHPL